VVPGEGRQLFGIGFPANFLLPGQTSPANSLFTENPWLASGNSSAIFTPIHLWFPYPTRRADFRPSKKALDVFDYTCSLGADYNCKQCRVEPVAINE
jgi:hypothetical protein